jgi:ectoine hydroxylase-related dioxygenase (phytanoyl-CoA dioxygenase family)
MAWLRKLDQDGFAVVTAVLQQSVVRDLIREIGTHLPQPASAGVRGLAEKLPGVRLLAQSLAVRALVEPVLGIEAKLVRSILFIKNEKANWQVAWHQDLAIAVRRRSEVEGYVAWSLKDGVPHVQPPTEFLEHMLTVRLHLDAADETNGALWVSPGSHKLGRLPADEAAGAAERLGRHLCCLGAGDALLLRPLTLHASRKVTSDRPRRVVHLEFAGVSLPEQLAWAEALE